MCENDAMNMIRKKISLRRKELGLSYQSLADKTGLSRSTLQRYETGSIKNMPLDKLEVLAKGLNVEPSYLMNWEEKNIIHSLPQSSILTNESMVQLPVLHSIKVGMFLFSQQNIKGYKLTGSEDISEGGDFFYANIEGDEMKDAGILPNDIVLIRIQSEVKNGDIALISIDKEHTTIKRIINQNNTIILKPENTAYELQVFSGTELNRIQVIGRIILTIHKF